MPHGEEVLRGSDSDRLQALVPASGVKVKQATSLGVRRPGCSWMTQRAQSSEAGGAGGALPTETSGLSANPVVGVQDSSNSIWNFKNVKHLRSHFPVTKV